MNKSARFSLVTTVIAVSSLYAGTWRAEADFIQTNLVSDIPSLAAKITEPELVNPFGVYLIPPRAPFGLRTRVPVQPLSSG